MAGLGIRKVALPRDLGRFALYGLLEFPAPTDRTTAGDLGRLRALQ
jgi:hypothetical protein